MHELRQELNDMLEYQANEAPPMSLKYAHCPAREGILMDFLYERPVLKGDADQLERAGATADVTDESGEMELDNDGNPLEGDEALRAREPEVVGEDVNIAQALREIQLEDQKASSDNVAKEQQEQESSSEATEDQ
jgi:hypothetical protein